METKPISGLAPYNPAGWPALSCPANVGGDVPPARENAIRLREQTVAMNEALVLGAMRQHELAEAAEQLNAQLRTEVAERQKTVSELTEKARLLDLSSDAILVRNCDGRILYWNHGAEELYGWSRAEALGKVSHELLQTEFPVPLAQITGELHRHNHWTGELVHRRRDGQAITVLVRKTLDRDPQGRPAAVLQIITDITERKRTENELAQARSRLADRAEHLEARVAERTAELTALNGQLEAFVYSIAHDLRAPLRSMQGFAALLGEDAGTVLSASGRDFVGRIDQSSQFMDTMLGDLLAFSRISQQHVVLGRVDLAAVVAVVLARLQPELEAKRGQVENAGPWPAVQAHEVTLTQALFNLASNAVKFVAPGTPPFMRLRTEVRGDFIRIWVEDNGPGIAPEHQAAVFRLFNRLNGGRYPGTGVGLTIVKKGIERMGGQVGVESTPGQGSRFWIDLAPARTREGAAG